MTTNKVGVPLVIPPDIWQLLAEVRSELDTFCPGPPTPMEEALRELIIHYEHCPHAEDQIEAFCERAKAWKQRPQA